MSRRVWLGLAAGLAAIALAAGAAVVGVGARVAGDRQARLEALGEAPPPPISPRAVPPPREAVDCEAFAVLLEGLDALEPVYAHEEEALARFLESPRVDEVERVYGALDRNHGALGRLLDAPYCARQGEVPVAWGVPRAVQAGDLVVAHAYVLMVHRDDLGALRWLMDLWLLSHELRRWGLVEHAAGLAVADRTMDGVERLMRRPVSSTEIPWMVHLAQHMDTHRIRLGDAVRMESHRIARTLAVDPSELGVEGLGAGALLRGVEAQQADYDDAANILVGLAWSERGPALDALEARAESQRSPLARALAPAGLADLDAEATRVEARERALWMAAAAWVEIRETGVCPAGVEAMRALHQPPLDPYTGQPLAWDAAGCAARTADPGDGEGPVTVAVPVPAVHP